MKSDLNRHVTSCVQGFTCECGKLLRTAEGLETHRRIFHREEGGGGCEDPAVAVKAEVRDGRLRETPATGADKGKGVVGVAGGGNVEGRRGAGGSGAIVTGEGHVDSARLSESTRSTGGVRRGAGCEGDAVAAGEYSCKGDAGKLTSADSREAREVPGTMSELHEPGKAPESGAGGHCSDTAAQIQVGVAHGANRHEEDAQVAQSHGRGHGGCCSSRHGDGS